MTHVGREFLQGTKYPPKKPSTLGPPADGIEVVSLPEAEPPEGAELGRLLASRRSRRKFAGGSISLADLSYLLWAADGLTQPERSSRFRTAPSAGARHPIDTYVVANRVNSLDDGIYRYLVEDHALVDVRQGEFESQTASAAAGQNWIVGSAAVFIWTAVFERTTNRYKERGYRYVFLDVGHIAQNLYLACESLGLGMTAIAALIDDEVNALVGADGVEESVLYMAALGTLA